MVILVLIRSPQRSVKGKFKLLSSASPKIVQHVGEEVIILHFCYLFKLFLQVVDKSALSSGDVGVFALFGLKRDNDWLEKLCIENNFSIEFELFAMGLDEDVIHFCQFVVVCFGDVEVGCQSNVIGSDFGKGLDVSVPLDSLNVRSDNFLLDDSWWLLRLNVDNSVIGSFHVVKLCFGENHFEGFWPVLLFASLPSHKSLFIWLI